MELLICLPPVLCGLFTFSIFFLLCYLFSAIAIFFVHFFCYFLYVKASYWNLLLFFRLFYLRRMDAVLSSWSIYCTFFSIFLRLSSWYFYFLESYIHFILQDAAKKFFFCNSCRIFTPVLSIWVSFFFRDWKTDWNEIHFLKAGTLILWNNAFIQKGSKMSMQLAYTEHYIRK